MTHHTQDCFRALADPTRREILTLLTGGEMTIAQLTPHFDMTRAAVKKHLTILQDGGLITSRTAGRERFSALNPGGLRPAVDWLAHFDAFWDDKLNALHAVISEQEPDHD